MVADVGQVAQKEGLAVDFRNCRGAVVGDPQRQPVGHAAHGGVGLQQERRQRVDLDTDQLGVGESLAGGQKEAPRARAGVDDACRGACAGGPADHGLHDGAGRVDRPMPAAGPRCAQPAEGFAEGVAAACDAAAQIR